LAGTGLNLQEGEWYSTMKILIVHRGDTQSRRPFISEQGKALGNKGIDVQYFGILGTGGTAYLSEFNKFKKEIKRFKPDLIHAHYGLSGLFANMQRKIPVITTYHGSDINLPKVLTLSRIAARLSKYNIYVSEQLAKRAKAKKKYKVIPCGVDLNVFYPIDKYEARKILDLEEKKRYILFSASCDNLIKNCSLAKAAINKLNMDVDLIELKGYTRQEVNLLFNASDIALMTSQMEGSPQFIKEAMACNCPIVSTNVGTVKDIIADTIGCYITTFSADDVAEKIKMAFNFNGRTIGNNKIRSMDSNIVAEQICSIYKNIL